jgi:hypothetical protein
VALPIGSRTITISYAGYFLLDLGILIGGPIDAAADNNVNRVSFDLVLWTSTSVGTLNHFSVDIEYSYVTFSTPQKTIIVNILNKPAVGEFALYLGNDNHLYVRGFRLASLFGTINDTAGWHKFNPLVYSGVSGGNAVTDVTDYLSSHSITLTELNHMLPNGEPFTASKSYGPLPSTGGNALGVSILLGPSGDKFFFGNVTLKKALGSAYSLAKFEYQIYRNHSSSTWNYQYVYKLVNNMATITTHFFLRGGNVYMFLGFAAAASTHYYVEATCTKTGTGATSTDDVEYMFPKYVWESVTPPETDKTSAISHTVG